MTVQMVEATWFTLRFIPDSTYLNADRDRGSTYSDIPEWTTDVERSERFYSLGEAREALRDYGKDVVGIVRVNLTVEAV